MAGGAPNCDRGRRPRPVAGVTAGRRPFLSSCLYAAMLAGVAMGSGTAAAQGARAELSAPDDARRAPEFTHQAPDRWINSAPLTLDGLAGQVVLLDFWTFDCWNCYRSFPWLNGLEARYAGRDLTIVGIHTPEFDHEKIRSNVERKVREFGLHHPVMIDNDFSYWRAMNNQYWPAFYLLDRQGRIRAFFAGETHAGDRRAKAIEKAIDRLLAEK